MLTHDQIYERLYAVWLDLEGSDVKTKLGGLIADLEAETLESEKPLAEGWAFLDDRLECPWTIAWLQDRSPSARYLIVTERKP